MMQSNSDNDLSAYFTDVKHLRELFAQYAVAQNLSKRLLFIHGIGGVGKSSLLRMLRLHSKRVRVPVGLVSGDEAKSTLNVLLSTTPSGEKRGWVADLKVDGVRFPNYDKAYQHYQDIQAKVREQAELRQKGRARPADVAREALSKTSEAAGGVLMGAAIDSLVPGIGATVGTALGSVLGGMGTEALMDWLYGFLNKPDIDILLDPSIMLTQAFIVDLNIAAEQGRIILILDAFEQMSLLDIWVCDIAQNIHHNVLLVIAGRSLPKWEKAWPEWVQHAHVEKLEPMTETDMRELIRRYYATIRGGEPDPIQIDAIIRFARGLPIAVTTAVQLGIYHDVKDFSTVGPGVIMNLVECLLEGVPQELVPALEVAAALRWFNQPILRVMMKQNDVREIYSELERFPFVRSRLEGLALHDTVREIIDENLYIHDSERHRELHDHAALYFETLLNNVRNEDTEQLGLERLYHRIQFNEEQGIHLFQQISEELAQHRFLNRLRTLLNDINTYPLRRRVSLQWRSYYNARWLHLDGRLDDARSQYHELSSAQHDDLKLQAYIMADYGELLRQLQENEKAIPLLEASLSLIPVDTKLVAAFSQLSGAYGRLRRIEDSLKTMERMRHHCIEVGDTYGLVLALDRIHSHYARGAEFQEAHKIRKQQIEALRTINPSPQFLRMFSLGGMGVSRSLSGRRHEIELEQKEALSIAKRLGALNQIYIARDLGYILGMTERYSEADEYFVQSLSAMARLTATTMYKTEHGVLDGLRGVVLRKQGLLDSAERTLLHSLRLKTQVHDEYGLPELFMWLGELNEVVALRNEGVSKRFADAVAYYEQSILHSQKLGKLAGAYWLCGSLTGLARIRHRQKNYTAFYALLDEAEHRAQEYEFNDHFASLRLTQAQIPIELTDRKRTDTLESFKEAMTYALRYNRFLLDEVLSGRLEGTPLQPIIPYCLEQGEEGHRFLTNLSNWWQIGRNEMALARPDTISPIPEGISLLEAERMARDLEPGNGLPQKSVVEQIEIALSTR